MILFFNVFITDDIKGIYDRGRLGPPTDRLSVFKYSLASFSVINWEHVVIYCELDSNYKDRWDELHQFVKELYPNATIRDRRNTVQKEWKVAVDELCELEDDGLVWFFCNDDHIFIDYELDLVERIRLQLLKLAETREHVACEVSHWPEFLAYVQPGYRGFWETDSFKILEEGKDGFLLEWSHDDSIQIVNKRLLRTWWFKGDYGDAFKPRTDFGSVPVYSPGDIACLIPFRELVRHFDGYSHVKMDLDICPPLFIPEGFFQSRMKISYCGESHKPGFVTVNPLASHYSAVSTNGADMKCLLEDLPLFWRDRIETIEIGREIDTDTLTHHRNQAVLRIATSLCKLSAADVEQRIQIALRPTALKSSTESHPAAAATSRTEYHSIYFKNFNKHSPKVSVVILDRYIAKTTLQSIESLRRQDTDPNAVEVVWLGTQDGIDRNTVFKSDLAVLSNQYENWSRSTYHIPHALNQAVLEARGEILIFGDSLAVFPGNFISSVCEQLNKIRQDLPALILCAEQALQGAGGDDQLPTSARCLAIRKRDLIALGGFDEEFRYLGEAGGLLEFIERFRASGGSILAGQTSATVWRLPDPRSNVIPREPAATGKPNEDFLPTLANPELLAVRQRLLGNSQSADYHPATSDASSTHANSILATSIMASPILAECNQLLLSGSSEKVLEILRVDTSLTEPLRNELRIAFEEFLQGNTDSAFARLERELNRESAPAELCNFTGILCYSKGLHAVSEQIFRFALDKDITNLTARMLLVELCIAQGRLQESIQNCLEALRYYPNHPQLWSRLQGAIQGAEQNPARA